MEILNQSQYNEFEEFASRHKNGNFTQSLGWMKLKSGWGHEIVVSRDENGAIVGGMLILINKLPLFGNALLYAPHGPVCDYHDTAVLQDLLDGAKALKKKHRAFAFKVDPCVLETDKEVIDNFLSLGFKYEPGRPDFETIQTRYNYGLCDIEGKTEDEVIMSFTQKTRYNIRLAAKKGVVCKVCDKSDMPEFFRLMKITAERDNFVHRPIKYYENMLDCFGDNMRLYLCYYNDTAISGALCAQYAGKTWYVFGASDNKYRNVMANHLMQWEMIKWALESNCFIYDFLGIPVNADENSPMIGVYRFKKGFNGSILGYAGEFDYILSPFFNKIFRMAQKAKRRKHQRVIDKNYKKQDEQKQAQQSTNGDKA